MRRLALLALIWGWSFLFIKVAVEGMTPSAVAGARIALGMVTMLLILRSRRIVLPRDVALWRHFFVMGFVHSAVPFTLLAWGEERITSALTAVLNATTPLFAALLTALLLGERLRRPQLVGIVLGFAGVAVAAVVGAVVRPVLLPRLYDLSIVLAANLQGWGEALGLYDAILWFDNVVHFTVPLLGSPVVYIVLARLDVVPDPRDETQARHYAGIFLVTLAIGLAIGAVWEMIEYASDRTLGTDLQIDNSDTVGDLFADGCGALCGSLLLVLWALRGWGSVRRIPGENRFEAPE